MAEELLSLKWNNHQAHFVDILTLLREKDMFIDVTIACGGKVYSAHKFVLSTCSDYFKQIFTRSPNSNPIVFMKDVSCRDIEALLDFMYNGEVSVPQSSLGSLIKTAEGLQIKGLAVPDDPPSRRLQERDKRERDPSLSFPENRSPPPKRRVREKNTPPRRLSNHQQQSRPSNTSSDNIPLESSSLQINNDSIEINSGLVRNNSPSVGSESGTPSDNNSKKQHNNVNANSRKHSTAEEDGDEDRGAAGGGEDSNHEEDSADNGSFQPPQHEGQDGGLGTAAVTHSKQEEMEIKQEDVVDLGEDDDGGDWGDGGGMGDGGADDGGVGGTDSLSSADNTVNFSDVLLSHSEGNAMAGGSGAAGDSAMGSLPFAAAYLGRRADTRQQRGGGGGEEALVVGPVGEEGSEIPRAVLGISSSLTACGLSSSRVIFPAGSGGDEDYDFSSSSAALLNLGPASSLQQQQQYSVRPHACHYCEKRFINTSHLRDHLRLHTGERPFRCSTCNRSFVQRQHLRQHEIRATCHPHTCSVCSSVFPDQHSVLMHMAEQHG